MGVFDALIIQSAPEVLMAEFARSMGPLETGSFDLTTHVWVPSTSDKLVPVPGGVGGGFGVDVNGQPYFDTVAVNAGDESILFVNAGSPLSAWLEPLDDDGAPAPPPTPSISDESTDNLTQTTATLVGDVNTLQIVRYQFEWGPTSSYGNTSPLVPGTIGPDVSVQAVMANITGLTAATAYHFRVNLIVGSTTINGLDQTFETLAAPGPGSLPTVGTGFVVGTPTSSTATVGAPVNPNGAATSAVLNYGPTSGYGSVDSSPSPSPGSGTSLVDVEFNLTGLTPGITYHGQVVATNVNGSTPSADFTFTTQPGTAPGPVTPPVIG
jgi:hypothetical protein